MPNPSRPSPPADERYSRLTRRPLNCLAFVLGPLVVYQVGMLCYGTELLAPRDVGKFLRFFGATAGYLPPLLILVVLLLQHIVHKHPWRVQPVVLGGMLAESIFWVLPLFSMHYLTWRFLPGEPATQPAESARCLLQAAGSAGQGHTMGQDLIEALGAGIYEEFIFRLVFISLVLLIFVDVLGLRKDVTAPVAVVCGAVLFGLYHLTGAQLTGAAALAWDRTVFWVLAGAYLGALFVGRGFGIAVGTHALWNIYTAFSHH